MIELTANCIDLQQESLKIAVYLMQALEGRLFIKLSLTEKVLGLMKC